MSMTYNLDVPYKIKRNKSYWEKRMNNLGIFLNRELEDGRLEYTSENGRDGYQGRLKKGRFKVESRFVDCSPL